MWNIFGTASYYPDIALIDAKVTWYVATCSIVMGHIASVFMGHRAALALSHRSSQSISSRFIWVLNLPMTFLMIAFTALSLSIIAEPLSVIAG
jgi:membrane protein YqaA with SNARE-associated domain